MKKQSQVYVLLVAVMICLIGTVSVQAASSNKNNYDVMDYNYFVGNQYGDYKYDVQLTDASFHYIMPLLVKNENVNYLYFVSLESFEYTSYYIVHWSNDTYAANSNSCIVSGLHVKDQDDNEVIVYISSILSFREGDTFNGAYSGTYDCNMLNDAGQLYQVMYDILTGKTDIPGYEKNISQFDDYQSIYDSELGHLDNISCSTLVTNSNANGDYVQNSANRYSGDKTWKYTYSFTTSTGFDLRQDGADVQYCVKIKGGYTTMTGKYNSLPTVVSDYCYAGNEYNYFYIGGKGLSLNDLYGQFRTDASLWAKTIDDMVYVYMRPVYCDGYKWTYGEWAKFYFKDGSFVNDGVVEIGTTSTGGISSEEDGDEDDFQIIDVTTPSVSIGEGTDLDEAESNIKPSGSSVTIGDDVITNIQSLVSQIGQIPSIIAKIFSFLPSWCLALVAVGFSMVVFLIIYKLIRG